MNKIDSFIFILIETRDLTDSNTIQGLNGGGGVSIYCQHYTVSLSYQMDSSFAWNKAQGNLKLANPFQKHRQRKQSWKGQNPVAGELIWSYWKRITQPGQDISLAL